MAVGRRQLRSTQQRQPNDRFRRVNARGKPNPIDARFKLRRNSIVKSGTNNSVTLYTSHFDARNKISAKRGGSGSSQMTQSNRKQAINAPRANNPTRANNNNNNNNNSNNGLRGKTNAYVRYQNSRANRRKEIQNGKTQTSNNNIVSKTTSKTGYRESTYTGKTIQISTTNELAPKERKAMVRGKTISVIARNRTSKANNKQLHKTINNNTWVGPANKQPSPEAPIASSSSSSSSSSTSKKSLPAKVVISNLHPNVTQEDILELFGAIGPLRDGRIKSVGTAEVIYRLAEDAFAAYSKYHGRNLDGQPMILKITTAEEAGSASMLSSTRGSKYNTTSTSSNSYYSAPAGSSSANSGSTPVVFTVKL